MATTEDVVVEEVDLALRDIDLDYEIGESGNQDEKCLYLERILIWCLH